MVSEKDAFRALHPPGPGTLTKVQTEHADMFALKPDQGGHLYVRDRVTT